jgi:hypothetical protein
MFPRLLSVTAAVLLSAAVVSADQARQRWPDSSGRTNSGGGGQSNGGGSRTDGGGRSDGGRSDGRTAAPRTAAPRGERVRESAPPARESAPPPRTADRARESAPQRSATRREAAAPPRVVTNPAPPESAAAPQGSAVREGSAAGQRTAQPRQRWPENPTTGGVATGVAVPRGSIPQRDDRWDDDRRGGGRTTVYVPRARVYNNYYYVYPRRYYPYGYGSFGLGYFYYDPYSWYPYDRYNYRFSGYGYGYPTGEIRLQVRPRDAEVYVDGYYAGRIDEFDGFVQALRLEEGPYTIEIVAPGFESLVFDVRIQPGRKITYRGDMRPLRP